MEGIGAVVGIDRSCSRERWELYLGEMGDKKGAYRFDTSPRFDIRCYLFDFYAGSGEGAVIFADKYLAVTNEFSYFACVVDIVHAVFHRSVNRVV